MKMYVNDLTKTIKFLRLGKIKNREFFLFAFHPELNIFQNFLLNLGIFFIQERKIKRLLKE